MFALLEVCFKNTLATFKVAKPNKRVNRNKVRMGIINNLVSGSARHLYQKGPALFSCIPCG